MEHREDIQYAVELTKTVLTPARKLETFGATVINYFLVSELLDEIDRVRIREGTIHAERPRVITPRYLANELVDNFGEAAREYAEFISRSPQGMRIVEFGLRFRKEEENESVVQGQIRDVADQIADNIKRKREGYSGVVIGVDDAWEVSLLQFATEVVTGSAPGNLSELNDYGLLTGTSNDVPAAVRGEIEADFRNAGRDLNRIHALGNKLRKYRLLHEYEDRFYALVRSAR